MESFKGIWIPLDLLELDISWTKRILIAEISQLEILDKGCIASNSHFATKLKLSNQAVSKALNELNKDGLINIDNAQTKRNFGRSITINFSKSAINFSKSDIHESGETKENKQSNKTNNILDEAESIYSHYKEKIKASDKKQLAINNILKWLKQYKKEILIKSIDNYKNVAETKTDSKYIKDCKNFFGVKEESKGYFIDFIDYKSDEVTHRPKDENLGGYHLC